MDESSRLKATAPISSQRCRAACRLLSFFLAVVPLVGCLAPKPDVPSSPSPLSFEDLVRALAQWRQLPNKREIRLQLVGAASAPDPQAPIAGAAPSAEIERTYKNLGLLAADVDFVRTSNEFRRLARLIDYDGVNGVVRLPPQASRLGVPFEKTNPAAARALPATLGIANALLEQHFNWRARVGLIASEDRRAALRALAGGDAALAASSLVFGQNRPAAANLAASLLMAAEIDKLAAALPDYLRRQLTLPYRAGSQFVHWAFSARGWSGVNSLYANPPLSTAAILHPERYFVARATPLIFFPAALLRRLGHSPIVNQSLGEDAIAGLLTAAHGEKSAEATATGWRGDQLWAFRDGVQLAVVWLSAWKSESQAQEFMRGYRAVIEARHRVRFNFSPVPEDAPWLASARDPRAWLLQRRGALVLLVCAAPATRVIELANDAWQDLELDDQATEMPFDWARRKAQWSPRSR